MYVIAIIGQKGGTGKTTISTSLAVAAELSGGQAAILDLDPQTNATNWKERRAEETPAVSSIQPGSLKRTLAALLNAGAEWVFIDTPGKSDTAAIEAARHADLVLIPSRAQIFDVETLSAVKDALRLANNPRAFVVLNGIHPSVKSVASSAQTVTTNFDLPVAPVYISHRAAYQEAPATGQSPQEIDATGKAAQELAELFRFVEQQARAITQQTNACIA